MNPAFECLCALSVILDLANGLADDKSMATATFALELAQETGSDEDEAWSAFMSALLRHLGCTAFASVEAQVVDDDIGLRAQLHRVDTSQSLAVVRAVASASGGLVAAGRNLLRLGAQVGQLRQELATEACSAARLLAQQLQLGSTVETALDEVFERYDGTGQPHGLAADAISRVGRLATTAHTAIVFFYGGQPAAAAALRTFAGKTIDPHLAHHAEQLLALLDGGVSEFLASRQECLNAIAGRQTLNTSLLDVAQAFGDFADLQTPIARGHSRSVASLVQRVCEQMQLPAHETEQTVLAAHLHDLGQVAIPTSIWNTGRALRPTQWERVRTHSYLTERVLAAAKPLAEVARIAGAHHERLDGSGYFRSLTAATLSRPERILAVCDVMCALGEERPHRGKHGQTESATIANRLVHSGQLDAQCVDAALAILGGARQKPHLPLRELTERETQVLRLIAQGHTNKEIGATLGISARTVQHHTIHIYEKLGINTRTGAALMASKRGLLGKY